jgi:hypothetical protein
LSTQEYFGKWFHAKNQPILPLSPQKAELRHHAGEPYIAVLHVDGEKRVVDLAGDWVSVMFLDDNGRVYLTYDFKRVEVNRLFLSRAIHVEYEGGNDRPGMALTYAFKADGSILIERRNLVTGDLEEKDSFGDSALNWENYPEFGIYQSVCRLNRES